MDVALSGICEGQKGKNEQISGMGKDIRELFRSVDGFLLPSPCDAVAKNKMDQVKISAMDGKFKRSVNELCQELFVNNLTVRTTSNGEVFTPEMMTKMFDTFANMYESGQFIDPGTMRQALGKKIAEAAFRSAFFYYQEVIEENLLDERKRTNQVFVEEEFIIAHDKLCRNHALNRFQNKMRPYGCFKPMEEELMQSIDTWFQQRKEKNRMHASEASMQARLDKSNEAEERVKEKLEKMEKRIDCKCFLDTLILSSFSLQP